MHRDENQAQYRSIGQAQEVEPLPTMCKAAHQGE
jgi:hypothetical protein